MSALVHLTPADFEYEKAERVRDLALTASLALTDVRAWASTNIDCDAGLRAANELFEAAKNIKSIAEGVVNASP